MAVHKEVEGGLDHEAFWLLVERLVAHRAHLGPETGRERAK